MIEDSVVTTRIKELTVGPILVEIDALRLAIAVGHHFAQRRILVREILTWVGTVFSNTAFDFGVVETLFRVQIKQKWILAELNDESTINTFVVSTAALGINEPKLFVVVRTFRLTLSMMRNASLRSESSDWL